MNSSFLTFSLVVIGYNTKKSLAKLLDSVNNLSFPASRAVLEVIYVDDGSVDGSFAFFNDFNLKFKKYSYGFKHNVGRVAVTSKGVSLANNEWVWFVRSNIVLNKDALVEFINSINSFNACAFMGKIIYKSKDLVFEKYLNNKKRGINKYNHNNHIHYKNLLFGNCVIKRSVFKEIKLNHKLIKYGGEELDFSFFFNQAFPCSVRACLLSVAYRNNHPSFYKHLCRLKEFGQFNVPFLNHKNKLLVFGFIYYLISFSLLRYFFVFFVYVIKFIYRFDLPFINYYIVRFGMLSAIVSGYMIRSK